MTETVLQVNEQGRILIPVHFREQMGLVAGSKLVARLEAGRMILEKPEDVFRRLRSTFKSDDSLVEELIRDRRAEASHE